MRAISSDRRSALAKQVQELYDVCSMTRASCSRASDCVGILNLSTFYLPGTPFRDERAIQNAIKEIKNNSNENNGALLLSGKWGCGKTYIVFATSQIFCVPAI